MMTREAGYYAINGVPIVVQEGSVVSYPDDAVVQMFETEDALNEVYPVEEVEPEGSEEAEVTWQEEEPDRDVAGG